MNQHESIHQYYKTKTNITKAWTPHICVKIMLYNFEPWKKLNTQNTYPLHWFWFRLSRKISYEDFWIIIIIIIIFKCSMAWWKFIITTSYFCNPAGSNTLTKVTGIIQSLYSSTSEGDESLDLLYRTVTEIIGFDRDTYYNDCISLCLWFPFIRQLI